MVVRWFQEILRGVSFCLFCVCGVCGMWYNKNRMCGKTPKKQIILFLIVLGIFSIGQSAFAALEVDWPRSPLGTELTEDTDIATLIKYFYDWGISLGGFAAFIALVVAGVQYLTSAGNAGKMSDAISRIRSAVIGLILLLVSVLILNTINPQLTQLKPPEISPLEPVQLATTTMVGEELSFEHCKGALLYPTADFQSAPISLTGPVDEKNSPKDYLSFEVGSVQIVKGLCQVKLFQLKDFKENADYPAISISADTARVANLGPTNFKSVKLIDLYVSP